MQTPNMSDVIEEYLKKFLKSNDQVEIRRNEIAEHFNCVPSQINYVIKTRFTVQQGYIVESKRGGGGYIRIMKVNLIEEIDIITSLIDLLKPKLSIKQAVHMIHNLYENDIVSQNEAELLLVTMEKDSLELAGDKADYLRSQIMRNILHKLQYKTIKGES